MVYAHEPLRRQAIGRIMLAFLDPVTGGDADTVAAAILQAGATLLIYSY